MNRVFHRSLCTSIQSSTTITTTTTTTRSLKEISRDLFKESNFTRLVDKFKKASDLDRFRTKTGIYEDTVRRLASAKRFSCVHDILDHQKNYPDISNEGFSARLITLYGKSGMYRHARKLFDEMPKRSCPRTVLSFNALLAACVQSRKNGLVQSLFNELPKELSVEPDVVSYNTLIKAFCQAGSFDSALEAVGEMEKKGIKPNFITFSTLLDGLYRRGRFEDGEKVWKQMGEEGIAPDIRSYNARLLGLALEKRTGEAAEFFEEMKKGGMKPDVFSFNALIRGFVNEGNLGEAKKWFGEIEKSEFDPDKVTYGALVPFLCEKGDLKTAIELSKEIFKKKCLVDSSLLQVVVDKLVGESKVSEAEEIVQLGKTTRYCRYELKLPTDEKTK